MEAIAAAKSGDAEEARKKLQDAAEELICSISSFTRFTSFLYRAASLSSDAAGVWTSSRSFSSFSFCLSHILKNG